MFLRTAYVQLPALPIGWRVTLVLRCREAKEEELKRKEAVLKLKEQEIHEHHVKVRQKDDKQREACTCMSSV